MKLLRNVGFALGVAWRAWPVGAVTATAFALASALAAGPFLALAVQRVVEDAWSAWLVVPIIATLVVVARPALAPLSSRMSLLTRHAIRRNLLAAAVAAPGLEHLENPVHADAMFVARARAWATAIVFQEVPAFVGALIATSLSLVLLWTVAPVLVLFAAGAAFSTLFQSHIARKQVLAVDRAAPGQRLAARIAQLATAPEGAKEVRMLDLGPSLIGEHRRVTHETIQELSRAKTWQAITIAIAAAARGVSLGIGVIVLLSLANDGRIGTADVALGLALLIAGLDSVGGLSQQAANVVEWSGYSTHLRWLVDYESPIRSGELDPPSLASALEVDAITFCYPGAGKPALRHVSLQLPAGRIVALVGENGAGKTTLVKLLCRFYDPDVGRISVGGKDLRTLYVERWRGELTGAFQDFLRPHTTVRDAVAIGDLGNATDAAIIGALREVGAEELLTSLPRGLDTQLGREFPDGVELSGGQWQLLALARAGLRSRPKLVVLDEPSSALDPRAEHETFERFAALSSPAVAEGAVVIFVSHRLSTTLRADLIVMMHEGTVLDVGTHDELLARCGAYAELFEIQASRYRG